MSKERVVEQSILFFTDVDLYSVRIDKHILVVVVLRHLLYKLLSIENENHNN